MADIGSSGEQQTGQDAAGERVWEPIHAATRIGHVHLKVSDLARSEQFYHDVLGFAVMARYGTSAVFMAAGGYHHHLALNTWESKGGAPPPEGSTGLYHFAILYANRRELARAVARVLAHGVELDGASDHGVSEAIYLHDPDDNGIELYVDRDPREWPRQEGELAMTTRPLDVQELLAELE